MLHELLRYADREGIDSEVGFGPRHVRFVIVFDPDGRFIDVIDQQADDARRGREFDKTPVLSQGQLVGNKLRHFLIDNLDKVALLTKKEPTEKEIEDHRRYVEMLDRAGGTIPRYATLARALDDADTLDAIGRRLTDLKAKPNDSATPAIRSGDRISVPVAEDDWHDWWRGFLDSLDDDPPPEPKSPKPSKKKPPSDPRMRCFLTGELALSAATQDKITGLSDVGGLPTGEVISSFDKASFEHFGLSKGQIASISVDGVKRVTDALNHAIAHRSRKMASAKIAYWYDRPIPPEHEPIAEFFDGIDDDDDGDETVPDSIVAGQNVSERLMAESGAGRLLRSLRSGEDADLAEASFYALTLSANSGRVVFRDWFQGPLRELATNVLAWFEDLAIVSRDGGRILSRFKFLAVVGATVRELGDAPPPMIATLWRAAVHKRAIPDPIAAQTLDRVRIDLIRGDSPRHAAMGLLRAHLIRHPRYQPHGFTMSPTVDENLSDQPAYLCGRIMALLDAIQEVALGDVGAGVVSRYYAAASTTPALVLGRMIRNAQVAHFPKARGDQSKKGLAIKIERQIQELMSQMTSAPPATLDLQEQTLFALGFYQQRADRFTKTSADKSDTADGSKPADT